MTMTTIRSTPAYTYANIGEEFILTITLEDVFGNPIEGKQVEWFMQGVGHFVTDDDEHHHRSHRSRRQPDIDVTDDARPGPRHGQELRSR